MKTILVLMIAGNAMVGNQLAYKEKHKAEVSPEGLYQTLSTDYLDENDKTFGTLRSDFTKNKLVPDYQFENSKIQLKEKVTKSDDGKRLLVEIIERGKKTSFELPVVENAVMGQGFHNLIMARFEELKVKPLEVNFIIPRKKDYFRFKIEKVKSNGDSIELSLRPSHFLLKAIVPKISVSYHTQTKKLLSFQGMTNIEDSNGEAIKAAIGYNYIQ